MPLTSELAAFCAGLRYADVPPEALAFVRIGFTDCVGTLIAGRNEPVAQKLRAALAPAPGESRLFFDRGTARPAEAAWLNATAAHALDFDDAAQRGHPSVVLVPSILAEADALGVNGRQMATAYAAGYETWAELVRREPDHYHNHSWHPTGVLGPVAAAAACVSLRGLDAGRAAHALAIAASRSAGLVVNFGSMTKPLHAGNAAHAGVLAARLAEAGVTASNEALEHPKGLMAGISPAGRVDLQAPVQAGRDWKLPRGGLNIKKYPACFATHRALDAMLGLLAEHPLEPSEVARVIVSTSRRNKSTLRYEQPQTALEARFSMHFAMAAALVARRAGLRELDDDFVRRDEVQQLMRRVEVLPDDREDATRPGEAPEDSVSIDTVRGKRFCRAVDYVRGGAERPLLPGEFFDKVESCLAIGGLNAPARPLFDALMAIDSLESTAELYRRGAA